MEYTVNIAAFLRKNFFRILLLCVIGGTSISLIYETGSFFQMRIRGYIIASLIEAMIISLTVYRPESFLKWITKYGVIAGLILIIIGGASNHAVAPILERDNIASADKLKLKEINEAIRSAEKALDSVPEGNPRNKLYRSQQIGELIDQKKEFIQGIAVDKFLETQSIYEIWITVGLRVLMQIGNLVLIGWFLSLINQKSANPDESHVTGDDSGKIIRLNQSNPDKSHVSGESDTMIMGFVPQNPGATRVSGVVRTDSALTRFIRGLFPLKADGTTIGRRKIADCLGMSNAETDLCFNWLKAQGLIKVKGTKTFPLASQEEMLRCAKQRFGVSGVSGSKGDERCEK